MFTYQVKLLHNVKDMPGTSGPHSMRAHAVLCLIVSGCCSKVRRNKKPACSGGSAAHKLILRLSRWILIRHEAYVILLLLIRKHHQETIPNGDILQRDGKPGAALVGPGRANACPAFLALFVFAHGLAVVEDIAWSVWHTRIVTTTVLSVGDE
jgi:hypothetical protein